MREILLFILIAYSSNSLACFVPGKKLANEPNVMVSGANKIVLARAVSMDEIEAVEHAVQPVLYKFEITEILKGSHLGNILEIRGDGNVEGLWDTTFSDHIDPQFIKDLNGRLGNIGDCVTLPPPVFKLGTQYLLFIGGVDDSKKYERVDSKSDNWYLKVKSLLSENGI